MTVDEPSFIRREADGATLAYHRTAGHGPGIVFLPGFRSDMTGSKALALEAWARAEGRAFLRFDYTGHGASSGDFMDGTIGDWLADAVFAIDHLTTGPQILVGSSMGGWIMLLAARDRPDRVAGMVGIAVAPDFTEDLMLAVATDDMKATLDRDGVYFEPSQYSDTPTPITRRLLEDGARQLVLRTPHPFRGPVRLIHGMADPDVPWQQSLKAADALASADVEVILVKNGDHRLSEPRDLDRLCAAIAGLPVGQADAAGSAPASARSPSR